MSKKIMKETVKKKIESTEKDKKEVFELMQKIKQRKEITQKVKDIYDNAQYFLKLAKF